MLTRSQFDIACSSLVAKYATCLVDSPETEALRGWTCNDHPTTPGFSFMSRTVIHTWKPTFPSSDDLCITENIEDIDDNAISLSTCHVESLSCQQYVVYSATFCVPTFYFAVHDPKGTPLSLADLLKTSLFRPFASEQTEATTFALTLPASSFPLLSQGEHPTLGTPCWYFHPCETAYSVEEVMAEIRETRWTEETRLVRWLEAWFMIVGTAVNLKIKV